MDNDFFNNHPILGSMFDFNHDGNMSLDEAGAMGVFGAMAPTEAMRTSEAAELEANELYWNDNDDDYDLNKCSWR